MPIHLPTHEHPAHRELRRKLMKFRWSVAELEWLMTHAKSWPPSLEKFIAAKLQEAKQERTP